MTTAPKMGRFALGLLPIVLVSVAFLAAAPWLKSIDRTVPSLVAATVSIFVLSYANYFAFFRGQDEVQKAGAGFAAQWGVPAGQVAFVLLLMFTSLKDLTSAVVSGECAADRHVVVVAMLLGCWTLVMLQTIGMHFANAIWWLAKR